MSKKLEEINTLLLYQVLKLTQMSLFFQICYSSLSKIVICLEYIFWQKFSEANIVHRWTHKFIGLT